jgi:hypothetical protein
MKQPKRPTRRQKEIIGAHKLNTNNWMIVEETDEELVVQYKFGKTIKNLKKGINKWRDK